MHVRDFVKNRGLRSRLAKPSLVKRPSYHGFTLVELLTTIVIIGVLAALTIGISGPVRERTRMTKCTNNLRQIGLAMALYANDHTNNVPKAHRSEGRSLWEGAEPANLGILQYEGYIDNSLSGVPLKGTGRSPVFDCPTAVGKGWDVGGLTWGDYYYCIQNIQKYSTNLYKIPRGASMVIDFIPATATAGIHQKEQVANVLYPDFSVATVPKGNFKSAIRDTALNRDDLL